jgi:hypothetical protein
VTAILVALVAASGCTYVPSRSLEYDPIQIGARHREKPSLVVMPLREERPPRHYPSQFGEITRYGSNDEGIDPNSLWAYHASALRKAMGEAKVSLEEALARRNQ